MSLIKQNIASLKKAEQQLDRVAKKAIVENMDYIMFLLKETQLGEGIRSDGKPAPYYAPDTIEYAKFNPPRTGVESKSWSSRFNYEWTGTWIDSLYVKLEKDGFNILAKDNKTELLEKLSRGKITALTEKNNKLINDEVVKPELFDYMMNALIKF